MTSRLTLKILTVMACGFLASPATVAKERAGFETLKTEAGIVFRPAANFKEIAPEPNPHFHFGKAMHHASLELEVRYAVRPLKRISIDFTDPHGLRPEPSSVFPMIFSALVGRFSKRASAPKYDYIPEQAKSLFNADWASASEFTTGKDAVSDYKYGLLVAIHKKNQGDAYSLFLYNDKKAVRETINKVVNSLSFKTE